MARNSIPVGGWNELEELAGTADSKIAKFLSVADGTVMSRLPYARVALAQRQGSNNMV